MSSSTAKKLLQDLEGVLKLSETAKTAEKSRVAVIRTEAAARFEQLYATFESSQQTSNSNSNGSGASHAELYVTVAETAFATQNLNTARSVLERFLQTVVQKDHYYCRAKVLLGLIIDKEAEQTTGIKSVKRRKLALAELMFALDVCIAPESMARYKFQVLNISLACWQIVSPFLRANRAKNFIVEMNRVCCALEAVDDPDLKWRILFLAATAVCFADDKQAKEASDRLDKAIEFSEKIFAELMALESSLSTDTKKCVADTEAIMTALRAVEEHEEVKNKKPKIDPDAEEGTETKSVEPAEFPPLEGLAALGYSKLKTMLNESQRTKSEAEDKLKKNGDIKLAQQEALGRLYAQRIHVNVSDFKKVQGVASVVQSLRLRTLVQLQCMTSGAIVDKDWPATFAALIGDLEKVPSSSLLSETLLDVSRCAWALGQRDVAIKTLVRAESGSSANPVFRVKLDLCKALRIVADIGSESANAILQLRLTQKQVEGFVTSRRIEAIKLLERTLTMCTSRLEDEALTQEICVAIWNSAMPLLQPQLRSNVHRAFQLAAAALETMSSPLCLLRAQLHFELSKCEEAVDFLSRAHEEGCNALRCDYGGMDDNLLPSDESDIDRNRSLDHLIRPFVHALSLRVNVYDAPSDPEGQVILLIQQIKESSNQTAQRESLSKAMSLMMFTLAASPLSSSSSTLAESSSVTTFAPQVGVIENLSLQELEEVLSPKADRPLAPLTQLLQLRVSLLSQLAQVALSLKNIPALLKAVQFVLSHRFDTANPLQRPSLDRQIDSHFLIAESLVERISLQRLDGETNRLSDSDALAPGKSLFVEPRALGLHSPHASEDMQKMKRLVLLALRKAIELSAALRDEYGVQNAVIYIWNLHLHIFRGKLFSSAMPEVAELLAFALSSISVQPSSTTPTPVAQVSSTNPVVPSAINERLRFSLVEGLSALYQALGSFPQAIELSSKAAMSATTHPYVRKRVVEQVSCQVLLAASAGTAPGSKGGAAKPVELPKFDHPLLLVFSSLAQAELPLAVLTLDQVKALLDKTVTLMDTEVTAALATLDWDNMPQEVYDQLLEMQAEAWTRLARGKLRLGDVQASQKMGERCMELVSKGIVKGSDQKRLSPRVWRWVSVCERYFGLSIQCLIQTEGQDMALQCELRLAALRHFTLAADYGHRAAREDLVFSSAIDSWNASIPLLDSASITVRNSLSALHKLTVDALLRCKSGTESIDAGPESRLNSFDGGVRGKLLQEFYLARIQGFAVGVEWGKALTLVDESFKSVPSALHRPLWKWRVLAMSKMGKDVMGSLAKLKEGDVLLQARVYAILARAASSPQQQLNAYRKTVEILQDDYERIDYLLETAQWLASVAAPRTEISEVVQCALDAIYEIEQQHLAPRFGGDEGGGGDAHGDCDSVASSLSRGSAGGGTDYATSSAAAGGASRSSTDQRKGSTAGSRRGSSASAGGSTSIGARGVMGPLTIEEGPNGTPQRLNLKQYEQAVRSLCMLAALESNETSRRYHICEVGYFLSELLVSWESVMFEGLRLSTYAKLPQDEREGKPLDAFDLPNEVYQDIALPMTDVLALLDWQPSEKFLDVLALLVREQPVLVPSEASLPSLPLTVHNLLWVATQLASYSMPKTALLSLGVLRALVMCLTHSPGATASSIDAHLAIQAVIYYRTLSIATDCGLASEATTMLSPKLGRTDLTPADYISCLANTPVDAQMVVSPELSASELLSVFGFSSFTSTLTNVDPLRCGLTIVEDLAKLGQTSYARSLVLSIRRDVDIKQWPRERLLASTLLAQLDLDAGRLDDALASVLSCAAAGLTRECGDGRVVAKHALVACSAYMSAGQVSEAKRVLLDAVEALQQFSVIQILPLTPVGSGVGRSGSHAAPYLGAPGSRLGSSIGKGLKSRGSVVKHAEPPSERSLECVQAFCDLISRLLDLLVAEAGFAAVAGKACDFIISQAVDHADKLIEVTMQATGQGSSLQARALELKAIAVWRIMRAVHAYASASTGHRAAAYITWLAHNLRDCISWQAQAVDILRGLLSQLSLDSQTYTPSTRAHCTQPSGNPLPEDPKATKGKGAVVSAQAFESQVLPVTQMLSLPLARAASSAEISLAQMGLWLSRVEADDIYPLPVVAAPDASSVECWLHGTTQPMPLDVSDFKVPACYQAAQLSASAVELLSSTSTVGARNAFDLTHADCKGNSTLSEALALHYSTLLVRASGAGAFDCLWRDKGGGPISVPTDPARNAGGLSPEKFSATRTSLRNVLVSDLLPRHSPVPLGDSVLMSVTTLIDSYGNQPACPNCHVPAAACFILILQSLLAREWLRRVWESTLTSSAVASSLQRLKSLESAACPHFSSQPQITAEMAFLAASSPAWRRLRASADPATIVERLGSSEVVVVCLVLDTASRTLYVTAGIGSAAAPGVAEDEFALRGTWGCARHEFDEAQRRILQGLVTQHKSWTDDCARFVNIYGETVSADQDLQGCEGRMGGKQLKMERSLEERLRALVSDLETVLQPVLGSEGRSEKNSYGDKDKLGNEQFEAAKSTSVASLIATLAAQIGPSASCLLLLDPWLQALPVEEVAAFTPFAGKVCRDFSIHMVGHRLDSFCGSVVTPAVPAKGAAVAPRVPSVTAVLPASAIHAVADPFGDDSGSRIEGFERDSIDSVFASLQTTTEGGSNWAVLAPAKGTVSQQDWNVACLSPPVPQDPKNLNSPATRRPAGLFIYTTGRLGSLLSPLEISALDLEAMLLTVACDGGHSDRSYRRQNVLDNVKSAAEIALEAPLVLHALVALGGGGCAVFQRWPSSLAAQRRFVKGLWQALGQGKSVVAALAAASLQGPLQSVSATENKQPHQAQLKPWVRLSRVVYGLPFVTYDGTT